MNEPIIDEIQQRMAKFAVSSNPEREAEARKDHETRERRANELLVMEKRVDWNAPKRHATCTPDLSGPWGEQFLKLKAMLDPSKGRLIALVGGRGNGKTQMAVEAMKVRTHLLKSARFASAVEFFIRIKATYRKDSDSDEMEVLAEFQKPSLLVIDEIGKRGGSEWENTMLFELLNRRYNDMKDTILIDNRSSAEFVETIGPSLASRMNEGGGIMDCTWESFR